MRSRTFSRVELAFFAIPRRWNPWIVARFGDDSDVRDAIIHADTDGGLGWLYWMAPKMSWVLSEKGKRWVGPRALAHGARWSLPAGVTDPLADTRVSDPNLCTGASLVPPKPLSFLCGICGDRTLGSDKCMSCFPPEPENP
jgi:hypothetical protein